VCVCMLESLKKLSESDRPQVKVGHLFQGYSISAVCLPMPALCHYLSGDGLLSQNACSEV